MAVSRFLKSMSNDVTDVCPNPNQYIGHRYENLERTPIWEYPWIGPWCEIKTSVDADFSPDADLSLSYISRLIQYSNICSSYHNGYERVATKVKATKQWFLLVEVSPPKFYGNYHDLVIRYGLSMLREPLNRNGSERLAP